MCISLKWKLTHAGKGKEEEEQKNYQTINLVNIKNVKIFLRKILVWQIYFRPNCHYEQGKRNKIKSEKLVAAAL